MTIIPGIIAVLLTLASVVLWKKSAKFTIDASPIGSAMIALSSLSGVAALFFAGIQIGIAIGR